MKAVCELCFRHCGIAEGETGYCGARRNEGGVIRCDSYGRVTALMLDPIEKKPLKRYFPGKRILSVGSYGCNMDCPFCQNDGISKRGADAAAYRMMTPSELVAEAEDCKACGNIGLAFTYNEPLIGYEFVCDCAILARAQNLKVVLVTNGCIQSEPWEALLPYVDAANIDLKGFSDACYRRLGGDFAMVCEAIRLASAQIHVEVTTLIVPGLNDDEESMRREAAWLASLRDDIPLHVTRFFPHRSMRSDAPTPVEKVYRLAEIAQEYLQYVYVGNC